MKDVMSSYNYWFPGTRTAQLAVGKNWVTILGEKGADWGYATRGYRLSALDLYK
jgi:hypothetical protein